MRVQMDAGWEGTAALRGEGGGRERGKDECVESKNRQAG